MGRTNNLSDLYLLVQIIEAGGFSAAAVQLDTTRSLLSRRVIALEERLGARLLHRNARQFSLTAVGEGVYRHAAAMCEAALAAERVAASQDATGGLVRIEVQALLSPLVAELALAFAATHPHVRFAVSTGGANVEALLRQQTDVVLCACDTLPDHADIVARPFGTVRTVTVGSPDLLQRVGMPRHPAALDEADCLSYANGVPNHWRFSGVAPRRHFPRMAWADLGALLSAARAGVGFAQLPFYMVADDLSRGRLRIILEAFEPPPLSLRSFTLSGRTVSHIAIDLVRFMQQGVAAMTKRWDRLATNGLSRADPRHLGR